MAPSLISLLLRRRAVSKPPPLRPTTFQSHSRRRLSTAAAAAPDPPPPKPPNLSSRLSFVFDQIDAIDRDRSAKDAALHRIRAWRESHPPPPPNPSPIPDESQDSAPLIKKEVTLVHPWPEWISLMERLAQQNYFDKRRRADENSIAENIPIDLSYISDEDSDTGSDFSRDWIAVRTACMNFGRARFDILRSLSRNDIQVLVGHGCPSTDPKVVFSAKLLRKYVHLDEGDVCSSCSLRNSCSRGYILTLKEDEARTLDVMRILLTFGFDHVNGAVENKPILKVKSMKTVVRKLLNEVVKLSAVPIDPNLPPPVIRKPPPKVKQPPPPPRKRVGRDDVEMKKGDWLCVKCDFMNFAKNSVCLQCDAKRPKRQLLPGEWECPQCDFLNYRRNMACFHCDHKRPPDDFTENQMQAKQSIPHSRSDRVTRINDVSNAWNFDFDDNESDGADVAAFEFAHPPKLGEDSSLDNIPRGRINRGFEDDIEDTNTSPKTHERGRYSEFDERKSSLHSHRTGFDDFDDEEDGVDSYELDTTNNSQGRELHRKNFSELEQTTDSEDFDNLDNRTNSSRNINDSSSGSEDDDLVDQPDLRSSHVTDSWRKAGHRSGSYARGTRHGSNEDAEILSDSDDDVDEDFKSKKRSNHQQSLGRKAVRRGIESDPDDDLFLGSESEDGDYRSSSGRKMRGSGREFRSDDRMNSIKNSFGNNTDGFSSRGSRRHDRGSRRDGHDDRRMSNRFQRFEGPDYRDESDPRQRGRFNQFSDRRSNQLNDRSRGSRNNGRGSHGGGRRDYGSQLVDRDGSDSRQRGRANQFNDRSRGSHRNGQGSHGGGYGGGIRNAGFQRREGADRRQQGRTDRSRNFDDYEDDDNRARRRIIER